jgi:hypothetical protein
MNKPPLTFRIRWKLWMAWGWLRWGPRPDEEYRKDYENLVRLARRCAYDFSHAADFIPTKDRPVHWTPDIDWSGRAGWWVALFAKGNPGKDYRNKVAMDLSFMTMHATDLLEIIDKAGLGDKVPRHIRNAIEPTPF